MLMRAARPGGLGLGGILIVIAILYFTGAGAWLLTRMQQLPSQCYAASSMIGPTIADPVCNGVGRAMEAVTKVADSVGGTLHQWHERVVGLFSGGQGVNLGGSIEESISALSSSTDQLREMMSSGPQQTTNGSLSDQFQRAVDSFTIGQQYIKGGDVSQALPWLQQGARQPQGFGLMSQLSLANMYRNGANGISRDPAQAQAYYGLASNSIGQLSQSNAPQAQQLLQTLPASPQDVQREIARAIATIKSGHR